MAIRMHSPLPAVITAAALFAALPGALAASAADQRYQDERAACMQQPESSRASCLREAAAARQAARRGDLSASQAYEANRTQRCNALPAADRDACIRRAREEGTISGSVEGGGILREYREVTLPQATLPQSMPSPGSSGSGTATEINAAPAVPTIPAAPSPLPAPVQAQPAPAHPAPAGVMLRPVN